MALQLGHEGLAEAHDLVVALALGVEVGAALAAAHGQAGEAVLKNLLKAQELDDGEVHAGVEAQAALVGTDGGVELHPEASVHLHLAVVVHPRDPEDDHPLRLHHPGHHALLNELRPLFYHGLEGLQHLVDRLEKFLLVGILALNVLVDAQESLVGNCHAATLLFSWWLYYTCSPPKMQEVFCKTAKYTKEAGTSPPLS